MSVEPRNRESRELSHHDLSRRQTELVRKRYNRFAPTYDWLEARFQGKLDPWRREIWERVDGERILEPGVGTGQNMAYYPDGAHVVAFDIAERMVEGARRRARETNTSVEVLTADVQALPFEDDSFDAAVATLVFCSVPDPVQGLRELRRVLVPGGQLLLLEHVLSRKLLLRPLMHLLNPVFRLFGDNINRKTAEHVDQAGFVDIKVDELWLDIMKSIEARKS